MGPIRLINLYGVINIEETDPSGKGSSNKFVQSGEKLELNSFVCVDHRGRVTCVVKKKVSICVV